MEEIIINIGKLEKEEAEHVGGFYYKDMRIILGKGQKLELSESGKSFNLIQLDENNKIIGHKNFRCSSCMFFYEIYD